MIIYRKNQLIETEAQLNVLLALMDDFVGNPSCDKSQPILDSLAQQIWNGGGERLDWQWDNETQQEYDRRMVKEAADADLLAFYQAVDGNGDPVSANLEAWKDAKIRPWRDQQLFSWVDITYIQGKKYGGLTGVQITERSDKYQELLDWPALTDFDSYKTDAEIDALKPDAPSYLI